MLKAQYRLQRRKHFSYAYRRGMSRSGKALKLVYVKSGPPAGLRVGFSVSKKVGNAVTRNHTKRIMRECMRTLIPTCHRGYYCIFVAFPNAAGYSYPQMLTEIRSLLTSCALLDEKAASALS